MKIREGFNNRAPEQFLEYYGSSARERLKEIISRVKVGSILAPVTVVVPSTYASVATRRWLASDTGLINIRFMVISRLAEYLGATALVKSGKSALSPMVKLAAVRHFASEMAVREPLGSIAGHPPLHEYLASTFDQLDLLSAGQLERMEASSPLLCQVIDWYRSFKRLTIGYYDREELAFSAARSVKNGAADFALKDLGYILIYLPESLTPGETGMVQALGDRGLVSLIWGLYGEQEADTPILKQAERLSPVLGEPPAIKQPSPGSHTSHILVAPDPSEEVRWVVRNIMRYAEEGVPFHRMAILYYSSESYGELLKNQLNLAGIPATGPDPVPLRDSTAGKLLTGLVEVHASSFSRDSLIGWVAECPVETGTGEGETATQAALWEEISGKAGIIHGANQWIDRLACYSLEAKKSLEKLGYYPDEDGGAAKVRQQRYIDSAAHLKAFVERLAANPPPADGTNWKEFSGWAVQNLKSYSAPEYWSAAEQASFDKVLSAVGELARLASIEPAGTSFAGFRQALADNLKSSSGRLGAIGEGVFTGPLGAAFSMDFEVIHLVGMAEGAFPPGIRDDAIIPDDLKTELGEDTPLKIKHHRRFDERRLYLAVANEAHKLHLSFSRSAGSGTRRSYPAAWLVEEATRLHRSLQSAAGAGAMEINSSNLEQMVGEPWLTVLKSTYHSLADLGGLMPADEHDYDMHSLAELHGLGRPLSSHFLCCEDNVLRSALEAENARKSSCFTVWEGNLSSLYGRNPLLGVPGETPRSPTGLQRWAGCPFSYFLKYILALEPLEKPEDIITISPLDRGSLVHRILERFMRTLMQNGDLPYYGQGWEERHRRLIDEIAFEEFDLIEKTGITGRELLWQVVKSEILQDLDIFLKKDEEMRTILNTRPFAVEHAFGLVSGEGSTKVALELGRGRKISFKGIIDRIDTDAGGDAALVIDYKTGIDYGNSDMSKNPLGNGTRLQLPIYALAVKEMLEKPATIKACYWFVSAKGRFVRREMEFNQEIEEEFRRLVAIIVESIEQGLFPANPGGESCPNCRYCDYETICPADKALAWERIKRDPAFADYIKMAGCEEEAGE